MKSESPRLPVLNAKQAAARLGVKVETIYAYVSRGVLERQPHPDGRGSLFDSRAIERLAGKRRGGSRTGGLSVVLGTGLTLIDDERLAYRGLDVGELARSSLFEAVAEWLWLGEAPPAPREALAADWIPWASSAAAVEAALAAQGRMPEGTATADRLRAIASTIGPLDPLRFDLTPSGVAASARRLIAAMVDGLPVRSGLPGADAAPAQTPPGTLAERLWRRLTARGATPSQVQALDAALILTADHGLASSTLAARVAASVRADPYGVVATGLGTLSGPLHGAASAPVHRLFDEVAKPERAVGVLGEFLRRESRIPGFGHVIYRGWDPRARVLLELLRTSGADPGRLEVVERVLEILEQSADVSPNIDFVIGALSYACEMPDGAGEALFGISRAAGWVAHALEEYDEVPLRFRPRAHYVGPAAPR